MAVRSQGSIATKPFRSPPLSGAMMLNQIARTTSCPSTDWTGNCVPRLSLSSGPCFNSSRRQRAITYGCTRNAIRRRAKDRTRYPLQEQRPSWYAEMQQNQDSVPKGRHFHLGMISSLHGDSSQRKLSHVSRTTTTWSTHNLINITNMIMIEATGVVAWSDRWLHSEDCIRWMRLAGTDHASRKRRVVTSRKISTAHTPRHHAKSGHIRCLVHATISFSYAAFSSGQRLSLVLYAGVGAHHQFAQRLQPQENRITMIVDYQLT
mmetsp:Transcript_20490/g.56996  ORF Transcript_20490/g.56996 Transcript_20490/m.56996 type:complete len:263 (+) Transcript_20490:540-1328(+)